MYHTQEILNLSKSLEGVGLPAPQDFSISKLPTEKKRFGDLAIGDLLIFDGKVIKKTGDLTAETNAKTGKQHFVFFKKDVVKSVVNKDQHHAKDTGFYYHPYIPILPAGSHRSKFDENILPFVAERNAKADIEPKSIPKKGGYDMFDMEDLPSFVGKELATVAIVGPETQIKVTFKLNGSASAIAIATVNDQVTNEDLVLTNKNGFVQGRMDLCVFEVGETIINRNYILFEENSCRLFIDGVQTAERQQGIKEGDTLTIRFKIPRQNRLL